MFYTKHIVDSNRTIQQADIGLGGRPIALSLEDFLDLYQDVQAFTASCYAIIDRTAFVSLNIVNIEEALTTLSHVNANSLVFSSIAGETRRGMLPIGKILEDGSIPPPSVSPTTLIPLYPAHSMGGGATGRILIDFGNTLFLDGLFYPFIEIEFANGTGSNTIGAPVGTISFDRYGSIALFSGRNVLTGLETITAGGSITVTRRFSTLIASNLTYESGQQLTLTAQIISPKWTKYTKALISGVPCDVSATQDSLSFEVPNVAHRGPIWFESDPATGNGYDGFLSYQEFSLN